MEERSWIIHIYGKEMNVKTEIKSERDLKIINLLIKRIKKYLEEKD